MGDMNKRRWRSAAFGFAMLAAGAWFLYRASVELWRWPAANAIVVSTQVAHMNNGNRTAFLLATFQYRVGARDYVESTRLLNKWSAYDLDHAAEELPNGSHQLVNYNPANPSQFRFGKGDVPFWRVLFWPLVAASIGLVCLVLAVLPDSAFGLKPIPLDLAQPSQIRGARLRILPPEGFSASASSRNRDTFLLAPICLILTGLAAWTGGAGENLIALPGVPVFLWAAAWTLAGTIRLTRNGNLITLFGGVASLGLTKRWQLASFRGDKEPSLSKALSCLTPARRDFMLEVVRTMIPGAGASRAFADSKDGPGSAPVDAPLPDVGTPPGTGIRTEVSRTGNARVYLMKQSAWKKVIGAAAASAGALLFLAAMLLVAIAVVTAVKSSQSRPLMFVAIPLLVVVAGLALEAAFYGLWLCFGHRSVRVANHELCLRTRGFFRSRRRAYKAAEIFGWEVAPVAQRSSYDLYDVRVNLANNGTIVVARRLLKPDAEWLYEALKKELSTPRGIGFT